MLYINTGNWDSSIGRVYSMCQKSYVRIHDIYVLLRHNLDCYNITCKRGRATLPELCMQ